MYKKLDHLLPLYLNQINMEPIFKFGEKFELDAKKEYRRLLRKKKQLKKAEQDAFAKG